MEKLIAFCGLDCAGCEAYIATQANDETAKGGVIGKVADGVRFTRYAGIGGDL